MGQTFHGAQVLTDRLRRWGFRCRSASNMRAASDLLSSHPIALVFSSANLSDGTGFGLLMALAGLPITPPLCLPVENSCYWLPAIDAGKACLGLTTLRPSEFANVLEEMTRYLTAAQGVIAGSLRTRNKRFVPQKERKP